MKRLFLIDGMAVLFRGYFALMNANLRSRNGEPTGGTFAFISALERLLEKEKPDLIAVAWDSMAPTFRHEQFGDYKANRPDFPPDLIPQLERVKRVVGYYHIPCLELDGYEADDIIGTMAKRGEAEGFEVYCVTPDKDFLQLVSEQTKIWKPSKPGQPEEIIDVPGVFERLGVTPRQVIDYMALVGDSVDNVPGVKGIGPKTAAPLIQKFNTLENLYEHLDQVDKKGVRTKLEEHRDDAFLSKELVTIHCEVPVDVHIDELTVDPPDVEKLLHEFDELGFRSLAKRYAEFAEAGSTGASGTGASGTAATTTAASASGDGTSEADESDIALDELPDGDGSSAFDFNFSDLKTIRDVETRYVLVNSLEKLDNLVDYLLKKERIAFDTETDGLDWQYARLLGLAFSSEAGEGFYVPVSTKARAVAKNSEATLFDSDDPEPDSYSEGLPLDEVLERLKPLLTGGPGKIGQHAKFDMLLLRNCDIRVEPLEFDSMLAGYILDSSQSLTMDSLAERYLSYRPISITELIGPRGKGQKTLREIPLETVAEYSSEDADVTFQLRNVLKAELEKENLLSVVENIEVPLVPVLTEMEFCGIKVDREALAQISVELQTQIEAIEREIYDIAGRPFTINSPKQLSEILFEELKLPTKKKTKTGYSTDQFVLEDLAVLHPLPEKILIYRQATKLKGTYVDALPELINPRTGRIHTTYSQSVAATGRLSSNNPNLQNIPIRSELGREIRKAFVPGFDDGLLISADYSQIELRIMAHITGDEAMVRAFEENFDIHTATAMNIFNVIAENVEPNMRRRAKEVNFGIMYGIGPFGLARRLKIDQKEARVLIDTYFEKYPGVREYMSSTLDKLREKGYVETLSGRRRYYGDLGAINPRDKGAVERAAINMPIQGTAADIIKLAMIDIHRELKDVFPNASMLLQVHDELVFEVPGSQAEAVAAFVKEKMETAYPLGRVALVTETGIGKNWFEAH